MALHSLYLYMLDHSTRHVSLAVPFHLFRETQRDTQIALVKRSAASSLFSQHTMYSCTLANVNLQPHFTPTNDDVRIIY